VEEFAERLTSFLNDGALCLMLSIGHQTGLFDTRASYLKGQWVDCYRTGALNASFVRHATATGQLIRAKLMT